MFTEKKLIRMSEAGHALGPGHSAGSPSAYTTQFCWDADQEHMCIPQFLSGAVLCRPWSEQPESTAVGIQMHDKDNRQALVTAVR